jgi:hypothetical protein
LSADDLRGVLEPDLADALAAASGGNAFAVVDLLRALLDADLVAAAPGGWGAVDRVGGLDRVRRSLEVMAAD